MAFKLYVLVCCIIGACVAIPTDHYGPVTYKEEPKPYSFSYGVKDDYRGTAFHQDEKSDGKQVYGSYTVQLPDGRKQTVKYTADHYKGFIADVSYYGQAQYPSKSPHPPFIVKPSYHQPEPVYHQPEPVYHQPPPVYHPQPTYH